MEEKVSLLTLFLTFAKIGVMTFGGGMAMLPMLTKEIAENRHWATTTELADYYAVGQCTPGIIAVNTATFIGHKKRGVVGGIFATLGMVFPSLIIIMALAGIISFFSDNMYVQKAFLGIRAGVCVLVISTVIRLWKSSIKGIVPLIIFLIATALSITLNISPVVIVLVSAIAGIIFAALRIELKGVHDD